MEVWIVQPLCEFVASETPGKGLAEGGVALAEGVDAGSEHVEGGAVVRGEDLALDDRKVNFDLIESTGVHGSMHNHDTWVTVPKFVCRTLTTMGGAVVDNPEHATR